jgi:sugar lactone lactonase YvrE
MKVEIFDDRVCKLGEGPLWHPVREQLFWFDILGKRLLSQVDGKLLEWQFEEHVSAAGWVDRERLLIASETELFTFNVDTRDRAFVHALEADNFVTRSNDGRADPWGGFWIGTMGKYTEPLEGAIYRYHLGEMRRIASKITVSNSICFAPDRSVAYYSDTVTERIMRVPLDAETGWPFEEPAVHLDLRDGNLHPDGAVTDADGNIWVALWGSAEVACYDPDGELVQRISIPALHTSCPAFGGAELSDLYVTSATAGLSDATRDTHAHNGRTFVVRGAGRGSVEPRVIL